MEAAANTAPPEPCSDPKPPEAPKAAPVKKTGVLLELDVMSKLVKLLEAIDDIGSLIRIINWLNDLLSQKVDAHRAASGPKAADGNPDNHRIAELLARTGGQ